MDEPGRDWMNTEGKRQTYQFWDKTAGIPASHSFLAVTCDPDCGTVMRVPYVEDTVNFTGHGGLCEISQKSMAFSMFYITFYRKCKLKILKKKPTL